MKLESLSRPPLQEATDANVIPLPRQEKLQRARGAVRLAFKQAGKTIDEEAALVRKALTASAALGVRRRGALFESWNGSRPSRKRKLLAQNPKDQPKDTCRRSEQTRSRAFCFSGKA